MKDRLTDYRHAMDKSIFKGERFTQLQKEQILAKAKKREKKKNLWFPQAMSTAFVLLFLVFGGLFLKEELKKPNELAEPSTQQKPALSETAPSSASSVEMTKNEQLAALGAPYDEIGRYLAEWELPTEGVIPMGEEVEGMETSSETIVAYENGYGFSRDTGVSVLRSYGLDGQVPIPTDDQFIGVFMGKIPDILDSVSKETTYGGGDSMDGQAIYMILSDIDHAKIPGLKELKGYSKGYEPIDQWLAETLALFEEAAASSEGKKVKELYAEGNERLERMTETIKLARE